MEDRSNYDNDGMIEYLDRVEFVDGVSGEAIQFKGHNHPTRLVVPNNSSLQFTDHMTVSYWLKIDNTEGKNGDGYVVDHGIHSVFVKDDESSIHSYVFTADNTVGFYNTWSRQAYTNISTSQWQHVAFVVSDRNVKIYINGVLEDEKAFSTPIDFSNANSSNLYIGGLDNDWYALWGCVDEFRMYNRALTEADIQEIYDTER